MMTKTVTIMTIRTAITDRVRLNGEGGDYRECMLQKFDLLDKQFVFVKE